MRTLQETLAQIESAKDKYDTCKLSQTATQSEILRDLATSLYDLAHYKTVYHKDWLNAYNEFKGSNAAKEKYADTKVSEMYLIRQISAAGQRISDAVRSTLSANK